MDYFIGVGGVGCKTLREYERRHEGAHCFYIDCVPCPETEVGTENFYCVGGARYSATGGHRNIGKNMIKYELLSRKLDPFFDAIRPAEQLSFTFVTTSFGGFGSAVVTELVDYLEAKCWEWFKGTGKCRVIAINETYCGGMPEYIRELYKTNTIEFVSDCLERKPVPPYFVSINDDSIFNPFFDLYLLPVSAWGISECAGFLELSDEELRQRDVHAQYTVKPVKQAPQVFISYSSRDQRVADALVDSLESSGIGCWIATRSIHEGSYAQQIMQGIRNAKLFIVIISKNSLKSEQVKNEIDRAFSRIKDGLKIIPFLIDDSELDDECSYYLCRQEMFFAKEPPMDQRIRELTRKIVEMFD